VAAVPARFAGMGDGEQRRDHEAIDDATHARCIGNAGRPAANATECLTRSRAACPVYHPVETGFQPVSKSHTFPTCARVA
jgi:hypothetical protein